MSELHDDLLDRRKEMARALDTLESATRSVQLAWLRRHDGQWAVVELLPAIVLRAVREDIQAVSVLTRAGLLEAALPFSRQVFELMVLLRYIYAESTESRRRSLFVAHRVRDIVRTKSHIPGTPEHESKGKHWEAVVGPIRFQDAEAARRHVEQQLESSGDEKFDAEVSALLGAYERKERTPDWGALTDGRGLKGRIDASDAPDLLNSYYRSLYEHQSHDVHGSSILDDPIHYDGQAKTVRIREPYEGKDLEGIIAADAFNGTCLTLLDWIVDRFFEDGSEARTEIAQARRSFRDAASAYASTLTARQSTTSA